MYILNGGITSNVIRSQITKEMLLSMSDVESALFLALAHAFNETNALTRMLYWAANAPTRNDAEEHGRFSMMLLLIQILAGKLYEFWGIFQKQFFKTKLSDDLEPLLSGEPADALLKLKRYFNKSPNSVKIIRNKFAFHYSPQEVSASLPGVDDQLELYTDDQNVPNNLFYFAEVILAHEIASALGQTDPHKALEGLVEELFDLSLCFSQTSDGLMDQILERQKKKLPQREAEVVQFDSLMHFKDVFLPWFTYTTGAHEPATGSA